MRAMRARGVTPHMAQNTSRRSSAIDGRTNRHRSYALSQRLRKRVEDIFGWMKTGGRIPEDALSRSEPHRGVAMGTRSDVERHVGRGTKAHSPPSHISKTVLSTVYVGGAEGIRTPDPLLAKQVLSRLSYGPSGPDRPAYAPLCVTSRLEPESWGSLRRRASDAAHAVQMRLAIPFSSRVR